MKIGQLAKMVNCPVVTIRYYESIGLLPVPERSSSGSRIYSQSDAERLAVIRNCRAFDMSLDDIRIILTHKDRPSEDCREITKLVVSQIRAIDDKIEALSKLKMNLAELGLSCPSGNEGTDCKIISQLGTTGASENRDKHTPVLATDD